jgi:hypothetical protein
MTPKIHRWADDDGTSNCVLWNADPVPAASTLSS